MGRLKNSFLAGRLRLVKALAVFAAGCAAFGVFAFAQGKPSVLVVYYSRDGHTQLVAEKIAEKFGADIERLIDKKKRTGPIGSTAAGKDAIAKKTTKLEPLTLDPQKYDIILVGTPSWFSNVTPAVRTFVLENDISQKKIGVFGTAHLTGIESCLLQLSNLIVANKEGAQKVPKLPLRHRDLEAGVLSEKIDAFYGQIMDSGEKNH